MGSFSTFISSLVVALALLINVISAAKHLNITVSAAMSGKSALQCWRLLSPLITSTQPGTQGSMVAQLGDLSNATYSIIPAGTNGGAHNAPYPQYALLLAGAAKITIPGSTQEAHIEAGKNGLVFAADTAALSMGGHVTVFTKETVLMQVPTANGTVPPHTVLHTGPCRGKELMT